MPLDPEVERFLRELSAESDAEASLSLEDQRRASDQMMLLQAGEPETVALTLDREIAGPGGTIPLRIYVPIGKPPFPLLLYLHAGGWVFGSIDGSDTIARALAKHTGSVVISVGYRLAPEYKFPVALEDCYTAACWASEHTFSFRADPERAVICGDSAGGNLAAAVTLLARERDRPHFQAQILIYPETHYNEGGTPSHSEFADNYYFTRADMLWFWEQYLANKEDGQHPHASPLLAEDLSNLPPALIITAEYDPVRDEGEAYAQRLREAGVPVRLSRYPGMIHGFFRMFALFAQSKQALAEIATFLHTTPQHAFWGIV